MVVIKNKTILFFSLLTLVATTSFAGLRKMDIHIDIDPVPRKIKRAKRIIKGPIKTMLDAYLPSLKRLVRQGRVQQPRRVNSDYFEKNLDFLHAVRDCKAGRIIDLLHKRSKKEIAVIINDKRVRRTLRRVLRYIHECRCEKVNRRRIPEVRTTFELNLLRAILLRPGFLTTPPEDRELTVHIIGPGDLGDTLVLLYKILADLQVGKLTVILDDTNYYKFFTEELDEAQAAPGMARRDAPPIHAKATSQEAKSIFQLQFILRNLFPSRELNFYVCDGATNYRKICEQNPEFRSDILVAADLDNNRATQEIQRCIEDPSLKPGGTFGILHVPHNQHGAEENYLDSLKTEYTPLLHLKKIYDPYIAPGKKQFTIIGQK